jgi:hypothetical protein
MDQPRLIKSEPASGLPPLSILNNLAYPGCDMMALNNILRRKTSVFRILGKEIQKDGTLFHRYVVVVNDDTLPLVDCRKYGGEQLIGLVPQLRL